MQLRSSQKLYVVTEKEKKAKENGGVNKPITPKTSVELTEKIETWCKSVRLYIQVV
uniref:Transposase n=1 Tax=Heterorhabditis bacteriophora TaxID=37862 RepID=A0A1I7WDV6_HETBA